MDNYKLTIIMPSFNKAKYIKDALDSVFMQKTTYPYQIIIPDDCSTDGTIEIIEEYQKQHSNITLLKSEQNQGLFKNVIRAYAITKTDYFCVLDPDDYWVDELKIQKSLDFLEKNPDYTIYVTNTLTLNQDGTEGIWNKLSSRDSDFNDFLHDRAVLGGTLGGMFRNVVFKNGLPEKLKNPPDKSYERTFRGDSFRNLIHIEKGKAHVANDYDGMYRITDEGLWQGSNDFERDLLSVQIFINAYGYFDGKYPDLLLLGYQRFNKINLHTECPPPRKIFVKLFKNASIFRRAQRFVERFNRKFIKF